MKPHYSLANVASTVAVGEKQKLFAISYRSFREGSLAGNNATLRYTLDPEDIHRSRSTAGSATFVSHGGQQSFSLFISLYFSLPLSLFLSVSFSPFFLSAARFFFGGKFEKVGETSSDGSPSSVTGIKYSMNSEAALCSLHQRSPRETRKFPY